MDFFALVAYKMNSILFGSHLELFGCRPPVLLSVHDRAKVGDPPTAMALGHHGAGLLMIVGHSSGQLNFWETRTSGSGAKRYVTWSMVKSVAETHAAAITAIAILEYNSVTWALAADAHGRLVCHNVNRHLNLAVQALVGIARELTFCVVSEFHAVYTQCDRYR
jgi:hypothetical protein